jgi:hypothetical protein
MSVKYFTGNNLDTRNTKASGDVKTYPTSRSGLTAPTSWALPETEPVDNADGVDVKPNRTVDSITVPKYIRIRQKVYSKTGDSIGKGFENNVGCISNKGGTSGKARASHLKGKYNLGHMWRWRKTLKKMHTAAGFP